MIPSESDPQHELLRSIANSLKGIQNSLDQLTGAVEGVAESIEIAHEPEGDLGHHLVGALKDIASSLHKRTQQERAPQFQYPQQRQNPPQQQQRRDDRHQRRDDRAQYQERPQPELQPPHQEHASEHLDEHHTDATDAQRDYDESDSSNFDTHPVSGSDLGNSQAVQTASPLAQELHPRKQRPNRRKGNRGAKPQGAAVAPAPHLATQPNQASPSLD